MLTVFSDLHLGALRSGGTTTSSAWNLRQHNLKEFRVLLQAASGNDLMILGDLFDKGNVPISDVLSTYMALDDWLEENPGSTFYNVEGNHDKNKASNILSSMQFLGSLLGRKYGPNQYVHIEEPMMTPYGYVIPHLVNQDVFDDEVGKVPECDVLFLHCNIANNFAAKNDQSLNLSLEQIAKTPCKAILCAHEHQQRTLGKVELPGNQLPTSISDFLGCKQKFYSEVENGEVRLVPYLDNSTIYTEMNWKELKETDHKFIRVVGDCEAEESGRMIQLLQKFRNQSEAFVITNAVNIKSEDGDIHQFEKALEQAKTFDVLAVLKEFLDKDEVAVLEKLNAT